MTELDLSGPNPWQTLSSRVVYDNGRLRLREDKVLQPDGAPGSYTFVDFPCPVVAIIALAEDTREVYLVRQWRYAWRRNSWEIPAGSCEPGEEPLDGARRELAEEVGLQASDWEPLGVGMGSATMSADYHLYLARGLRPAQMPHQRDGAEGDLIVRAVPLEVAVAAAMDGRIVHAISVAGLLRAARHLSV